MRFQTICIGILFCLLFQQDIAADTLYTWITPEGTIHITKTQPAASVTLKDRLRYSAGDPVLQIPKDQLTAGPNATDTDVLAAAQQAKLARQQAQAARQTAEAAIERASRIKKETETFLEPWRGKKRIRKPMQLQIQTRIQNANQVIAEAERLIAAANEAELRAQTAEKKARRTQEQFLEAYQSIVSK